MTVGEITQIREKSWNIFKQVHIRIALIIIVTTIMMNYDYTVASARSAEKGISKPLAAPCLKIDTERLFFVWNTSNQTYAQRLLIRNCGSTSLTLFSAKVSGANSDEFFTENPNGFELPEDTGCFIWTTFKRKHQFKGDRTGRLRIRSSAKDVTISMKAEFVASDNDDDDDGLTTIPGPPGTYPHSPCNRPHNLYFRNNCSRPVKLAVRYWVPGWLRWQSTGWWSFDPNERDYLLDTNYGMRVGSHFNIFYYYAETTDGSNIYWWGDHITRVSGKKVPMKKKEFSLGSTGDYVIGITCN